MAKKIDSKTIALGILLFVLNVILLAALIFLMIELQEGLNVFKFIEANLNRVLFIGMSILLLLGLTYAYLYFECGKVLSKLSKIVEVFAILDITIILNFVFGQYIDPNARPFGFLAVMTATLLGRREAVFLNVISALMMFVIDINLAASELMWKYCACLLMTICSGTLVTFVSHKVKSRIQSILLVLLLLIPIELIIGIMEIIFAKNYSYNELILLAYGGFGALSSILLYLVLLPVFELVFAELTVFRLRELTSNDSKLIKKLKNEAPGTYNHSVVVAQLAEACANAIGDDGELARTAAYYHDMGKLKQPEMFTENQADYNVHNEFAPELSADIIRSHARDGAMLIRKHHLPEFLADVAIQHHGTLPIKYFYAKALKMSDGEINIANYSYAGPTPKSKIAAIIMIADAAEAASRSLSDRSMNNVQELVKNIIEERIDLDQFVDCDITMRELTVINQTIAFALSGVYHTRISYPKIKVNKKK